QSLPQGKEPRNQIDRKGLSGPFLWQRVVHFCSGQPVHLLSALDTTPFLFTDLPASSVEQGLALERWIWSCFETSA
ncbi:hypothetical protein, partial [Desulfovibrio sp. DV]|uniref:hypothetical protein n=1 Tax=Desulfovibrio sp. DV TaxID=1844708 RepID=UPI001C377E03